MSSAGVTTVPSREGGTWHSRCTDKRLLLVLARYRGKMRSTDWPCDYGWPVYGIEFLVAKQWFPKWRFRKCKYNESLNILKNLWEYFSSPISAFLSLKAVATDLITLKLIRIFQFTSILSIFVQPCRWLFSGAGLWSFGIDGHHRQASPLLRKFFAINLL